MIFDLNPIEQYFDDSKKSINNIKSNPIYLSLLYSGISDKTNYDVEFLENLKFCFSWIDGLGREHLLEESEKSFKHKIRTFINHTTTPYDEYRKPGEYMWKTKLVQVLSIWEQTMRNSQNGLLLKNIKISQKSFREIRRMGFTMGMEIFYSPQVLPSTNKAYVKASDDIITISATKNFVISLNPPIILLYLTNSTDEPGIEHVILQENFNDVYVVGRREKILSEKEADNAIFNSLNIIKGKKGFI